MSKAIATDRLDALLAYMREYNQHYHQWPTYPEMSAKLGVTRATLSRWLDRLQIQGRLINHGQHGRPEWEITTTKHVDRA